MWGYSTFIMLAAIFSAAIAAPTPAGNIEVRYVNIEEDSRSKCLRPIAIRGSSTSSANFMADAFQKSMTTARFLAGAPVSNLSPQGAGELVSFDLIVDMKKYAILHQFTQFDKQNEIINDAAQTALAAYASNLAYNYAPGEWKASITFINLGPYELTKVPKAGEYSMKENWTTQTDASSLALRNAFAKWPECQAL
jgi:hypothetical protein